MERVFHIFIYHCIFYIVIIFRSIHHSGEQLKILNRFSSSSSTSVFSTSLSYILYYPRSLKIVPSIDPSFWWTIRNWESSQILFIFVFIDKRIFHIFVYPSYILYCHHPRSLNVKIFDRSIVLENKNRMRIVIEFSSSSSTSVFSISFLSVIILYCCHLRSLIRKS